MKTVYRFMATALAAVMCAGAAANEGNIVRVTRRGSGDVAECVSFTEERQRFLLFVR